MPTRGAEIRDAAAPRLAGSIVAAVKHLLRRDIGAGQSSSEIRRTMGGPIGDGIGRDRILAELGDMDDRRSFKRCARNHAIPAPVSRRPAACRPDETKNGRSRGRGRPGKPLSP